MFKIKKIFTFLIFSHFFAVEIHAQNLEEVKINTSSGVIDIEQQLKDLEQENDPLAGKKVSVDLESLGLDKIEKEKAKEEVEEVKKEIKIKQDKVEASEIGQKIPIEVPKPILKRKTEEGLGKSLRQKFENLISEILVRNN